jgi:hypothetical protein
MPKGRKKKIQDLEQIDGKLNTTIVKEPTRMDVLFGNLQNKYTTTNRQDYEKWLNSIIVADLRNHAVKIGLIPSYNTDRLKKQLLTEFDKYIMAYNNSSVPKIKDNLTQEQVQLGRDIMKFVK